MAFRLVTLRFSIPSNECIPQQRRGFAHILLERSVHGIIQKTVNSSDLVDFVIFAVGDSPNISSVVATFSDILESPPNVQFIKKCETTTGFVKILPTIYKLKNSSRPPSGSNSETNSVTPSDASSGCEDRLYKTLQDAPMNVFSQKLARARSGNTVSSDNGDGDEGDNSSLASEQDKSITSFDRARAFVQYGANIASTVYPQSAPFVRAVSSFMTSPLDSVPASADLTDSVLTELRWICNGQSVTIDDENSIGYRIHYGARTTWAKSLEPVLNRTCGYVVDRVKQVRKSNQIPLRVIDPASVNKVEGEPILLEVHLQKQVPASQTMQLPGDTQSRQVNSSFAMISLCSEVEENTLEVQIQQLTAVGMSEEMAQKLLRDLELPDSALQLQVGNTVDHATKDADKEADNRLDDTSEGSEVWEGDK